MYSDNRQRAPVNWGQITYGRAMQCFFRKLGKTRHSDQTCKLCSKSAATNNSNKITVIINERNAFLSCWVLLRFLTYPPLQLPALCETQSVSLSQCLMFCFVFCFNRAFVPCFDSVTRRTCTLDPPSSFASCLALYTRSSTRTHICNPLDGRRPQDFVPELFRHPGGSGWDFQTASCSGL